MLTFDAFLVQAWFRSDDPDLSPDTDAGEYHPDSEGVKGELKRISGDDYSRKGRSVCLHHPLCQVRRIDGGTANYDDDTKVHEPLTHAYRAISEEDYQRSKAQGYLDTHGQGNMYRGGEDAEGMVAAIHPHVHDYVPLFPDAERKQSGLGRVIKIKLHPDEGWRNHYADYNFNQIQTRSTDTRVPWHRVVDATKPIHAQENPESGNADHYKLVGEEHSDPMYQKQSANTWNVTPNLPSDIVHMHPSEVTPHASANRMTDPSMRAEVNELSNSMRQHGWDPEKGEKHMRQKGYYLDDDKPVTLWHTDNGSFVEPGNHRAFAAEQAGLQSIPVTVKDRRTKTAGKAGDLPEGITFKHDDYDDSDMLHTLYAHHPDGPKRGGVPNYAGHIAWFPGSHRGPSEIALVNVSPKFQRRGLGGELFRRAKEISPDLQHSPNKTDDGEAWAHSVGTKMATQQTPEGLKTGHAIDDNYSGENHGVVYASVPEPGHPLAGKPEHLIPKGHRLVGMMEYGATDSHYADDKIAHIKMINTHPDFQRQGIASAMLGRLKEEYPTHRVDPGMTTEEGHGWWEGSGRHLSVVQ